jgi:hypothetical protein
LDVAKKTTPNLISDGPRTEKAKICVGRPTARNETHAAIKTNQMVSIALVELLPNSLPASKSSAPSTAMAKMVAMTNLPPETPQAAAARAALYSQWMTIGDMAAVLGVPVSQVTEMRRRRELLGVWVHEKQEYSFPPFQLHEGKPNAQMPRLLSLITDVSGSGWGLVEWLTSCPSLLNGHQPTELIAKGRFTEVLAAAEEEALDHPDGRW